MAILEVRSLSKYFSGLIALDQLNLDIAKTEIVGLIGPNGSGKSTLFNLIGGFYQPSKGEVKFSGRDITNFKPHKIARLGIGRTFQAYNLFMKATVFDNVLTAFHMHYKQPEWKSFLHTPSTRKEEGDFKQKVMEILEFTSVTTEKDKQAEYLSSGYKKTLGIAIALATNPELLLLDEPVTTLSQKRVKMIMELIDKIRRAGTTVVIIEHNMRVIMDYCDRIIVLAYGRKLAEGLPGEIKENKDVIEAYLGAMG